MDLSWVNNINFKDFIAGISLGWLANYLINLKKLRIAEKSEEWSLHHRRMSHYNELGRLLGLVRERRFITEQPEIVSSENKFGKQKIKVDAELINEIDDSFVKLCNESKKLFGEDIKEFLNQVRDDARLMIFCDIKPFNHEEYNEIMQRFYKINTAEKYKKYLEL